MKTGPTKITKSMIGVGRRPSYISHRPPRGVIVYRKPFQQRANDFFTSHPQLGGS